MMNLDLSFYNWALFTNYIQKGLIFSIQLTVIATIGGILVGTILALMRLSGKPWLCYLQLLTLTPCDPFLLSW
jgi:glutamate/aspartate transport system permease protein